MERGSGTHVPWPGTRTNHRLQSDRRTGILDKLALIRDLDDRAGLEKFLGILRRPVDLDLVVDMRSGAAPRAAQQADLLAAVQMLTDGDGNAVEMRVARNDPRAVVDVDDAAELALGAGEDHGTGRRVVDRGLKGRREIETGMRRGAMVKRIVADPEAAFELVMGQRRRQWQSLEGLSQSVGNGSVTTIPSLARLEALERDERTALTGPRGAEACDELIEVDTRRG